jgi:hypothetical protein
MLKYREIGSVASATAASLRHGKCHANRFQTYLRGLDILEKLIDANRVVTQVSLAKEMDISCKHLIDLMEDFPGLGKVISNCKRRTIVESFSIVPDL